MPFTTLANKLQKEVIAWEKNLLQMSESQISEPRNGQKRNIKEIVGHMLDSVSNNTHRLVHLQYRELPLQFPNYATNGNNDKWIKIQNYREENWYNLVQLWKFAHLHFIHVVKNINTEKLDAIWLAGENDRCSLKEMVEDFPRHFQLHISEIQELIEMSSN